LFRLYIISVSPANREFAPALLALLILLVAMLGNAATFISEIVTAKQASPAAILLFRSARRRGSLRP
jgi:hypothetical protein